MLKDQVLDGIVQQGGNVAQFVSFSPQGKKRHARIQGITPTQRFASIEEAVSAIFKTGAPFVNIRSFKPEKPDGNPFLLGAKHGLNEPVITAGKVRELLTQGLHVIVNEDIDINDGGFSGVLFGGVAEFAPCDTPRCVEKAGCATLSKPVMADLVREVYRHRLNIPFHDSHRVEFSVHPRPVGYLRQPQIIWQEEMQYTLAVREVNLAWPHRYSQFLGDKVFGLLIAHLFGFLVPATKVFNRAVPFFEFGRQTGSGEEPWVRTCPRTQQPGLFTTRHGWLDAFELMKHEDPDGTLIAAIAIQDNVQAAYSGAAVTDANRQLILEGTVGYGDRFMVGSARPVAQLPEDVVTAVTHQWKRACSLLGAARFEWVYDGTNVWILQFHAGKTVSHGSTIVDGDPDRWERYAVTSGLEGLRTLVREAEHKGFGIILVGNVGITSHFGDVLRRANVPSRLIES